MDASLGVTLPVQAQVVETTIPSTVHPSFAKAGVVSAMARLCKPQQASIHKTLLRYFRQPIVCVARWNSCSTVAPDPLAWHRLPLLLRTTNEYRIRVLTKIAGLA